MEGILEQFIPLSEPKRYCASWMNKKVVKIYRKKYFAWKRYMESKSSFRWREYVKERNKANRIERDERRIYEKKLAKEVGINRRGFFKYVNSKLTVRPEISALLNTNGELVHDEKEMANISNQYFHASFNIPIENEELPEMENLCEENISDIQLTQEMVKEKLENLNKYKSCGPDNIHPHVLKETAASTSLPLSMIFKESLRVGETPVDWKKQTSPQYLKKEVEMTQQIIGLSA